MKDSITMVKSDGMIITASGHWFNVLDPNPDEVRIEDIAHALANQCRFTGHTSQFYSVAQHSVLVSWHCDPEDALAGLLHDASEAYLSDIARPVKKHPDFGPFYLAAEEKLTAAVYKHFGLDITAPPASVKLADDLMLRTEARDLMPDEFPVYEGDTLPAAISGISPQNAYIGFMDRFEQLYGDR